MSSESSPDTCSKTPTTSIATTRVRSKRRGGDRLTSAFGNQPVVMPNDPGKIAEFLLARA